MNQEILFLDIFSGISGDMFLGAMIDLGVDAAALESELAKLGLEGFHIHTSQQQRQGIAGVKFDVHEAHSHAGGENAAAHDHGHDHRHDHGHGHHHDHGQSHSHSQEHQHGRSFAEIRALIEGSSLSPWVKAKAIAVFTRIAFAEGKIHGYPPDQVHFHEVGAIDSIVDVVGACIALERLGKPRVLASPVVEGSGWIHCAHGRFPIPAPATLEILAARRIVLSQCDEPHELVTPTGAALLAEFVEVFGSVRGFAPRRIGYGLGARENHTRPNVLRAMLGEAEAATLVRSHSDWETDQVVLLETNIDDLSAEIIGDAGERALALGALDFFVIPAQMKKNRPGFLLGLLCAEAEADRFCEFLLRHTSAFGVRRSLHERRKLRRHFEEVQTPWGKVTIKVGMLDGEVVHRAPECESCRAVATAAGVPLREVFEAAIAAIAASTAVK